MEPAASRRGPPGTVRGHDPGRHRGTGRGRDRLDQDRSRPDRQVDHAAVLSLGTDGFGRSDTREALRRFFETDAEHIVVAVLSALADMGEVKPEAVADVIKRYEIEPDRPSPLST